MARDAENLCVRAFESLHPSHDFTFRISSEIPLTGGLGSSASAIVAGLLAADHLFELDVDLLARATAIEGHPDNVAAALHGGFVICADGRAVRFEPPTGLEALAVVPEQAVHTSQAREALPAQVPIEQAVFNVAHGALLTLGLARGDWDLVARGLARPASTSSDVRTCSRAPTTWPGAPPSWERSEPPSRARGPRSSSGASTSTRAPSSRPCAPRSRAGPTLLRAPFEAQGAYVEEM